MEFKSILTVHAIKESVGQYEGRDFSSTTFHCEVDLKENGAGRSMGCVTRPFKLGDAKEFDKWAHLSHSLPIKAEGVFEMEATKEDGTRLKLIALRPLEMVKQPAKVA